MISIKKFCAKNIMNVFIFFILLIIGTSQLISAEPEKPAENAQPGETAAMQDKKSKEGDEAVISNDQVKVFLKGIEFYGSIAKPQTVFIIPGTDPRVDGLKINRHFFSHIFRPVEKSTLRRVRMKQGKNKDHILW